MLAYSIEQATIVKLIENLVDIRRRKWSLLLCTVNIILFFVALSLVLWVGKWFWDKINLFIVLFQWLWIQNKILFALSSLMLVALLLLLGKYPLTQLWKSDAKEGSTMRMPEGDILKYVDGVILAKYEKNGKRYVDGAMVVGGITPVREVPEDKIVRTDKTVTEVAGSYLLPIISWFLRGMK